MPPSPRPPHAPHAPLRADAATFGDAATADAIYDRVCRTNLSAPGWCVANLGVGPAGFSSRAFRRGMLRLAAGLSDRHERPPSNGGRGEPLAAVSAGRFDQQTTTRPHLDGGPAESLLVLGYEPTAVASTFAAYDLARFAADRGLSPAEALRRHNPMFPAADDPWEPYQTAAAGFAPATWRVVVVNNSSADPAAAPAGRPAWRGVLHTAAVPSPDAAARRVVNSLMLAPARLVPTPRTDDELAAFAETAPVLRRGYDTPDAADDA